MATQVQFRQGTSVEHAAFIGAAAELTIDTDKWTAVIHDGVTAGGTPLMRRLSDDSAPVLGGTLDLNGNGLILSAGNTLTNSSGRPKFTGAGLDHFLEFEDSNTTSTPHIGCEGNNLVLETNAVNTYIDLRSDVLMSNPNVPSSAADAGLPGQMSWDADYWYVCVAPNTWKRTPIATW